MCGRITLLTFEEIDEVVKAVESRYGTAGGQYDTRSEPSALLPMLAAQSSSSTFAAQDDPHGLAAHSNPYAPPGRISPYELAGHSSPYAPAAEHSNPYAPAARNNPYAPPGRISPYAPAAEQGPAPDIVARAGSCARPQAFPGSAVHAIVGGRAGGGSLGVAQLVWGMEAPWASKGPGRPKLVFNTRIESALGGSAMWARAFADGRCLLPAATFFEPHASETELNPKTGRRVKRSYEFSMASGEPLLLASVCENGRLSVVTTEPNDAVRAVHPRMPLALRFEEVPQWLEGSRDDIAALADRGGLLLQSRPEPRFADAAAPGASNAPVGHAGPEQHFEDAAASAGSGKLPECAPEPEQLSLF